MGEDNKNIQSSNSSKTVVQTDNGKANGQDKCPKCGSTDISPSKNGKLRCNFCRHEFEPEKIEGMVEDISKLEGQVVTSGLQDIAADAKDVITLKCSSCGAEVVIDTASSAQARCHWCRNTLSINQQIPNGSVPDEILPFKLPKETAQTSINTFVKKRNFYAHPKFKKEFTTENIMGVYFPYMLVDINGNASFIGEGEHQKRSYYVGSGDNREQRYDADVYHVERAFDITINGLSIESNSDRLNNASKEKTNNIINSIMPFDTENCVKYNANYLKGYTSEKRDTNVEQIKGLVDTQAKDIARFAANDSLQQYDRGVAWTNQTFNIKGQQWKAAYLPVWLYSYQQVKGEKKLLHYVAVNARTGETMGSVPIHMPKLVIVSSIIEIFGIIAALFVDSDYNYAFLALGIIYFIIMYLRYRNSDARHTYEEETKRTVSNLTKVDKFLKTRKGLSSPNIAGFNSKSVEGATNNINNKGLTGNKMGDKLIDAALGNNKVSEIVKNNINNKNNKNKDK